LQQEKLAEQSKESEGQRQKELERFQREADEMRRREDEARLQELQLRAQQQSEKDKIVNKNKTRQTVSFSLFG